jgi:RimJ/RimL family protein N-acetyltransferase
MEDYRLMLDTTLTVRARIVWEGLAAVPVAFAPEISVAVSPASLFCPTGWAGLVVISGEAVATAPDLRTARIIEQALSAVPVESVTDDRVLRGKLHPAEILGPARLAYLEAADFRQHRFADIQVLDSTDPALQRFLNHAEAGDLSESGMQQISSPAFAIREQDEIIAAAGYRDWPGNVAHLSVLTAAQARGRGLAQATASAAVSHALAEGKLPQWRARPLASRRVAANLGFRHIGSQVSIRLSGVDSDRGPSSTAMA